MEERSDVEVLLEIAGAAFLVWTGFWFSFSLAAFCLGLYLGGE